MITDEQARKLWYRVKYLIEHFNGNRNVGTYRMLRRLCSIYEASERAIYYVDQPLEEMKKHDQSHIHACLAIMYESLCSNLGRCALAALSQSYKLDPLPKEKKQ